MIGRARSRLAGVWRRAFAVLAILSLARVAFGVVAIFLLDDYGLAWGLEATIIFGAIVVVGTLAFVVLRWTYHPAGNR